MVASSELQLHRELDRARPADLVEGVEPAVGAAGPEAAGQGLRRAAEQPIAQVADRRAEVRVVEDVEELGSEQERCVVAEPEAPLQRNVDLRGPETPQHIAAEIALLPGRGGGEGVPVEDLPSGILIAVDLEGHSRVDVWSVAKAIGEVDRTGDVHRRSRSREEVAV